VAASLGQKPGTFYPELRQPYLLSMLPPASRASHSAGARDSVPSGGRGHPGKLWPLGGRPACVRLFARSGDNANVTTLVERRSRFLVLLPNPDRRPAGVAERIQAALGGLAQDQRQTVTFDRGFEFMGYPALDRGLAVTSTFCDPRSPWQKGGGCGATCPQKRRRSGSWPKACRRLPTGSMPRRAAAWAIARLLRCLKGVSIPFQPNATRLQPCRVWPRNSTFILAKVT